MLEMRNVLSTKLNKKGFTLAELLVVVAIIAILVAVSIPIFTGKLEEARKSTDAANVRAAKAAIVTEYLSDKTKITSGTGYYYDAKNGVIKANKTDIEVYGKAKGHENKVVKVTITETAVPNTSDVTSNIDAVWD